MTITEPAEGLIESQIQELVEYCGVLGTRHIALYKIDIIQAEYTLR